MSDEPTQGEPTSADITAEAMRRYKAVCAQGNNVADFNGELLKAQTVCIICMTHQIQSITRGTT